MCLAIAKPKGVVVPREHYENGFDSNSDGAGFAYVERGKIIIEKGFFTFAEFWAAFEPHQKKSAVVHFRLATHGKCDAFNCHPWELCDGHFAMIHNGIIDIQSTKKKSDSGHFAHLVLEPAIEQMGIESGAMRYLVENSIGAGNKLCVLGKNDVIHIFNEQSGHWLNGAWYSNHSYEGFSFSTFQKRNRHALPILSRCEVCGGELWPEMDGECWQCCADEKQIHGN